MEQRALGMSLLGYGCMRFPKKGGHIDMEETEKLVLRAIEGGITYFDTAYIYTGSEEALGEILARHHKRESVRIATKLPHYLIKNLDTLEKLFQTSLKRLQTDYIDNMLMHMLPDVDIWNKLKAMGVDKWLEEKKASGQIRHIGFSFHGNADAFIELLEAYPWEFCQCQYNYMDENSQAGRRGVQRAYELGIPVIIMEPLRGGRLTVGLPEKAKKLLSQRVPTWRSEAGIREAASPAEWGLNWLYDQKEIACVLSGMGEMPMLEENMRIAGTARIGMYDDRDRAVIEEVRAIVDAKIKVPCTGCGYCMPCPFGVDIPGCFRHYNNRAVDGWFSSEREYLMTTTLRAKKSYASLCRQCGRCEKLCPQKIPIREKLAETARVMENPIYKIARFVSKGMFRTGKR
ncbi:MAG: aldo/keto reductase [Lachnospiraceae bacterium]|nr:aldo/keto reductase [Lachnospiraceae bacterium]